MRLLILVLLLGVPLTAAEFGVHEWGTFTSVVGSDGRMLSGLEVEEERVPAFVRSFPGFAPLHKGLSSPLRGVTVKMETPVLYFYSDVPRTVEVRVGFKGGSISQWYPERTGGEAAPQIAQLDFTRGYRGEAMWRVDVLAPATREEINTPRDLETPQWPRARVADANLLRGPKNEIEGFIFYRGLGNFALPLQVAATDGRLTLLNAGAQPIPFLCVYEKPAATAEGQLWLGGPLAAGARIEAPLSVRRDALVRFSDRLLAFATALQRAGLTPNEARAMLATWEESYFARPGLRVFWIVPRALTDAILPIEIKPRPDKLERVLVGRTEVLTPGFEAEIARDFALDGGKRWMADRYFRAYRERARQLRVVVGVAPFAPSP